MIVEDITMLEKFADGATRWVGSTTSIILHTVFFIVVFGLLLVGVPLDTILLVLTTAVSLEAIYLALFIQRSVNLNTVTLEEAAEDIQGIEEDVEDISEDIEGIEKDIDEISEEVGDIGEDIDEVGKDLEGLEDDIDGLQQQDEQIAQLQVSQLEKDVAELRVLLASVAKTLDAVKLHEIEIKGRGKK
jgi:archaellum component FlaC